MMPLSQILLALFSLPSPPSPIIFEVGPIALSYHGLLIALGIAVGTWLTGRELARRGFDGALALGALFFVVPLASSEGASTTSQPSTIDTPATPSPRSWRPMTGASGSTARLRAAS